MKRDILERIMSIIEDDSCCKRKDKCELGFFLRLQHW